MLNGEIELKVFLLIMFKKYVNIDYFYIHILIISYFINLLIE
jgi:hypothetical protein